jgi:hypothetical protein
MVLMFLQTEPFTREEDGNACWAIVQKYLTYFINNSSSTVGCYGAL